MTGHIGNANPTMEPVEGTKVQAIKAPNDAYASSKNKVYARRVARAAKVKADNAAYYQHEGAWKNPRGR